MKEPSVPELPIVQTPPIQDDIHSFENALGRFGLLLRPLSVETLQVNLTKLCNQACLHCHVDASPTRTEQMDRRTVVRCLQILEEHEEIRTLDLTGGAPELNPHFMFFVSEARKLGKHVMVRHNLTVTLDGHPVTGEPMHHLPSFFAANRVEVISSLPYYLEYFTDRQRGRGVFAQSIESLRLLNKEGFGIDGTGLVLNLVYNPVGPFLPASQDTLEADFKKELQAKHNLFFNRLFTITNMPIHRFREQLERSGGYGEYMGKLINAFNPSAAEGVMCRTMISVGHNGVLYDCDFNQMLDLGIINGEAATVFNFDKNLLRKRHIRFDAHCFGCTAGAGSSCGGTTS